MGAEEEDGFEEEEADVEALSSASEGAATVRLAHVSGSTPTTRRASSARTAGTMSHSSSFALSWSPLLLTAEEEAAPAPVASGATPMGWYKEGCAKQMHATSWRKEKDQLCKKERLRDISAKNLSPANRDGACQVKSERKSGHPVDNHQTHTHPHTHIPSGWATTRG